MLRGDFNEALMHPRKAGARFTVSVEHHHSIVIGVEEAANGRDTLAQRNTLAERSARGT